MLRLPRKGEVFFGMREFLSKLTDVTDFKSPWQCGAWSDGLFWLHVSAAAATWIALAAFAFALARFISYRSDFPFRLLGILFIAAILSHSTLSFVDMTLFWQPWFRLSAVVKAVVAAFTCLAAAAGWLAMPKALALPNPSRLNDLLHVEIRERERANERSRLVVEMAPNAIVMANQNGRIVQVNVKAERYFGYDRTELIGQYADLLVPARFRELPSGDLFAPRLEPVGAVDGLDLFGLRKDGSEFPIEIAVQPIVTERDVMVLIAISDVTMQKEAEAALKKAARDLQRSNGDLSQFAYVASHDLKEPLRKVSSFCQLLRDRCSERLDADGLRYVDYAVDGAQRMQALITALLELAQVNSSDRPLSPIDANAALETALENLRTAIEESDAEVSHGRLPTIAGDATQLTQLFQNLIGNAIKFRGPRRPEICVDAVESGEEWQFSIQDNGIGIAEASLGRIFGIFQRLHTREEYPGTGIGLAVCKRIVERLGGRIWVESKEGAGTTFRFTVPQRGIRQTDSIQQEVAVYAT